MQSFVKIKLLFCWHQHARIYLQCQHDDECQYLLNDSGYLTAVRYTIHISWVPELLGINCIYFGETKTNLIIKWNKPAKIATNFPLCKKQTDSLCFLSERLCSTSWFLLKCAESTILLTSLKRIYFYL